MSRHYQQWGPDAMDEPLEYDEGPPDCTGCEPGCSECQPWTCEECGEPMGSPAVTDPVVLCEECAP